jgi:hypothetical protein
MNEGKRADTTSHTDLSQKPAPLQNALGRWGQVGVVVIGLAWLALFTGGLTIATEPYRTRVSPLGAATMADTTMTAVVSRSREALGLAEAPDSNRATNFEGEGVPSPWYAAIMVALFFTPTNVALLSVLAGMLGAFGARSNLRAGGIEIRRTSKTRTKRGPDRSADAAPANAHPAPAAHADHTAGDEPGTTVTARAPGVASARAVAKAADASTAGLTLTAKTRTPGHGLARPRVDNVNPYLSGVLRGFFVYLAVISGLMVLLGNPFENITPFSYIRFAGLLSLFSFTVSYNPDLFSAVVDRARGRVQEATVQPGEEEQQPPDGETE